MIPIPYYQVVEFLSWMSERHNIRISKPPDRDTLKQLALEYLRSGGLERFSLSRVLQLFQTCPMIGEPDVRDQMRHFAGCGECLHFIHREYGRYPVTVALHPFLKEFLRFCQRSRWAEVLEIEAPELDRVWRRRESGYIDGLFREYIHRIAPDLLRAFEEYLESADPTLVRDYEERRRELRESPTREARLSEEGTMPLGANESLEQAAERLVDSVYLLLEGQFYEEEQIDPQVLELMKAMGLMPESTAQGIEFLSWLQEKHPKLNLLGNIPTQEILELVSAFCEEKEYTNAGSFSKEVKKWLKGDVEKRVLRRLRKMGVRARRRRGDSAISPLDRYQQVPYHAMFLFLSADNFPEFIQKYWEDLNYLTADSLDVYYSAEDLQYRVSGYEVHEQLRSVRLEPMSLPALILWKQSLSDCCAVPLERLSHDEVFDLMQLVVQNIDEEKDLRAIAVEAQTFVQDKMEQKGIAMKSEIKIDRVNGDQVYIGDKGTQFQYKTVGEGKTPQQFFSEIRQSIEKCELSNDIKAALIEDTKALESGDLDRMAAAQRTENILKHAPSLREKFKDFVLGVGSSLTATGAWEYSDEILAGIRFILGIK